MAGFNLYALQAAIHTALTSDTALMGMVSGIYDHVPAKTEHPYVTVGNMRVSDMSAGAVLLRAELALHTYSRARGRKEASDIMGELHRLLQAMTVPAMGYSIVSTRHVSSEIVLERDGLTYQGRMRFEVVLQQEAGA